MSLQRRKEVIEFAREKDLLLIEDSPYKEFNFEGESLASLFELWENGNVIHFGTFSKTFMPGLRLGWIIASEEIIDRYVIAKQNTDLCSSPLNQKICAKFIEHGYFDDYLKIVKIEYKKKRDAMLKDFEEFMPKEVSWNSPNGGLFLFIRFPEGIDSKKLFDKAIEKRVAYVPGTAFFVGGKGKDFARINFSYSSIEQNREGVKRLAELIKSEIR
jgi:2-aminoadipate transaminase